MEWANQQFGYQQQKLPTRIVLKTQDPSDPALVKYLADRNWRTNTDKTRFSKVRTIVNWIVGIVGGIGVVMLLFGLLVFSLFIQVTIAASRPDIELLKTLGLSRQTLHRFLMQQFMPVHFIIMLAVLLALSGLQWVLQKLLAGQGMYVAATISPYTIAAGALVLVLIWLTNRGTIQRYLRQ
jgi:cell division protein FtsX